MSDITIIIFLGLGVVFVFAIRLLGAWMLRIDEVIRIQKKAYLQQTEILKSLSKNNETEIED